LRETERLDRQRMVIAMDVGPGSPEDDARHDWAHKTALGLLAMDGIRAMVDPGVEADLKQHGATDRHIETLHLALNQTRQELTGEAGVARRREMFRVASGRDVTGAVEMLRLLQLQIEGKAAEHAQELPPAGQLMAAAIVKGIDPLQIGFIDETPSHPAQPAVTPLVPPTLAVLVIEPMQEQEQETSTVCNISSQVLPRSRRGCRLR